MTVLQEIEDLRQKLRYYSDKYYNDNAPEIEDYQYDMTMPAGVAGTGQSTLRLPG